MPIPLPAPVRQTEGSLPLLALSFGFLTADVAAAISHQRDKQKYEKDTDTQYTEHVAYSLPQQKALVLPPCTPLHSTSGRLPSMVAMPRG